MDIPIIPPNGYIIIGIIVSIFYGICAVWVFQRPGAKIKYRKQGQKYSINDQVIYDDKGKIKKNEWYEYNATWWIDQFYFNSISTLIGFELFYEAFRRYSTMDIDGITVLMFTLGFIGILGRLGQVVFAIYTDTVTLIKTLLGKFLPK